MDGYDGFGHLVQLGLQVVLNLLLLYYLLLEIEQLMPPRRFPVAICVVLGGLALGDERVRLVVEELDLPLLVAVAEGDLVEQMDIGLVVAA